MSCESLPVSAAARGSQADKVRLPRGQLRVLVIRSGFFFGLSNV